MSRSEPLIRISIPTPAGTYEEFDENLTDRILKMEFSDKASGADEMKLTFDNHDLELLEHPSFADGKKLAVLFGYPESTYGDGPIEMTVKKVEGFIGLMVTGPASGTAQFLGRQRTRTWDRYTEWEVAAEIAEEKGYSADFQKILQGDFTEVRRGITQAAESDLAFLNRIATRVDCVFFLSNGIFHFHPPSLGEAPVKEIIYRDSEIGQDFGEPPKLEYSTLGRRGRATRRGVSTRDREVVSGTAGNEDDPGRPALGDEACISDPSGWESIVGLTETERRQLDSSTTTQEEVAPTNAESNEEAERDARRAFRSSERSSIKLDWKLVGDPELVADNNIQITGIGQRFSGLYNLNEVIHSIGEGGYSSSIKASRNATSSSGSRASSRVAERLEDSDADECTGQVNGQSIQNPNEWDQIYDELGDE